MKAKAGDPLPLGDEHAVSVYFPTWKDTLAYARQDPAVLRLMKTGYPRFFVPRVVRELAQRLLDWAENKHKSDGNHDDTATTEMFAKGQLALLFPSEETANACRRYLATQDGVATVGVLQVSFEGQVQVVENITTSNSCHCLLESIYVVTYPEPLAKEGKAFWQHTGYGASSRRAAFWLENAPFLQDSSTSREAISGLPVKEAEEAKLKIRKRIGDLLSTPEIEAGTEAVYLYPTGMSAVSHSAIAMRSLRSNGQRVCRVAILGFLYVDTFKVLSKIHRFYCELYSYVTPSDLNAFEADLASGLQIDALYTEFPGNPLLGAVELDRLHQLSKEHGFLFVVDDTIATSVNVSVLPYCDMVCTSLTKMFSGGCNVMGGSVTLNPHSDNFKPMRQTLNRQFLDAYFPLDALVMEKNSSDFESRVTTASKNAEHIADMLRRHPAVEKVYYPKGNPTQELYDRYRRPGRGYGYLLSILFVQPSAAIAFHDALDVAIGPSLGTNFTLCCAYTLFAHCNELEWAAKFGVVEHLVRISVGIESEKCLDDTIQAALDAAVKKMSNKGP